MEFEIHVLSDSSATLYFEQKISPNINDKVLSTVAWIRKNPFQGLKEIVPAYASVTVFYDILKIRQNSNSEESAFAFVEKYLSQIPFDQFKDSINSEAILEIPVAYKGEDLAFAEEYLNLSKSEIIELHTAPVYRVYMIGFLPGFAYLGGMNKVLALPRKSIPSLNIAKGSVGIAGLQTGVYPIDSPGGWQIIGQTTQEMFDLNSLNLSLLNAGDKVKFVSV
ncbi:MAG: inhibitor of KinA [Arcticibacterium sp.]|jgi:inhibitor of KinA